MNEITLDEKHCKFCGVADQNLSTQMIRTKFSFGKNFPVEYEDVVLCDECTKMYEKKNNLAKVGAVIALIVIFSFMGLKFFFLYSSITF